MENSLKNKNALLLGNGLNLLDSNQSFSWLDLLQKIKVEFNIITDLDNEFKPFPLVFEEMLNQKPGQNSFNSKIENIKKSIRSIFDNLIENKRGYNDFHKNISQLNYDDILTTNYDYSVEKSLDDNFKKIKKNVAIDKTESKHSLKRGYKINNKTIWHIHGELFDCRKYSEQSKNYNEESIMIGYEHYSSYFQKIQENIKGQKGKQKIINQSLMTRLKNHVQSPFWTDIFFTHNIDIIGLSLDFSEFHLWWLINYRSNEIRKASNKHQININNKITYYYPKINEENNDVTNNIDDILKFKNKIKKSSAIAELLKAFNIYVKEIEVNSYEDFYSEFIKLKIEN